MTSTSEKTMTKFQSLAFLLLLTLLGAGALVEGNCEKKGDSIICTKTSNSSSHYTTSHSSTQTTTRHSSSEGVIKSEDTSPALESESAPSLEEALAPLPVLPLNSAHAVISPNTSPSPVFFSVCGYHQPSNYHSHTTSTPCVSKNPENPVQSKPVPSPIPSKVLSQVPSPVQSPVPSPAPSSAPLPSLAVVHPKIKKRTGESPLMVMPIVAKRSNFSEVITKRMRSAISSGNFSTVAQEVTESDDIYGLTMGLMFTKKDKNSALVKSPQRNRDGDVVAIKGLLSAGLNKSVKSKVVQLLVLAVTSPTGYHFTQFRPLIEHLTKIVEDNSLLLEIIKANPQTYSRRMLLCAGCSPVYSYVCAHCWPQKVCQVYYWCPKTTTKSPSKSGGKTPTPTSKSKSRSSAKEKERSFKEESNEEEEVKSEIEAIASMESPILETKQKYSNTKHKTLESKASEVGLSSKKNSTVFKEDQVPDKKTTKTDKEPVKGPK